MACQCLILSTLRSDEEKLAELTALLIKYAEREKYELTSQLNKLARETEAAIKPDNLQYLNQSLRNINKELSKFNQKMLDACNRKKLQLKQRISLLEREDKKWHASK